MPPPTPEDTAEEVTERGWEEFEREEYTAALESANQALTHVPDLVSALSLRAAALEMLDRVPESAEAHEAALHHATEDLDVIANAAQFYLDHAEDDPVGGDWLERAARLASDGTSLARNETANVEAANELVMLETEALLALGRGPDALACIDRALRDRSTDSRLMAQRGHILFQLCRFSDARRQLEAALTASGRNARAQHTLGLIAERAGDRKQARTRFKLAEREAPDEFPRSVQFSRPEFDAAVEDALRELPPLLAKYLSNVAVIVEDVPSEDDLLASDPPFSPTILGIFRGAPVGDKASMDPWSQFPSSIVLYQRNLERFATDRADLVEQIRITLLHEVGHFVGLDDEDLRTRGLD